MGVDLGFYGTVQMPVCCRNQEGFCSSLQGSFRTPSKTSPTLAPRVSRGSMLLYLPVSFELGSVRRIGGDSQVYVLRFDTD